MNVRFTDKLSAQVWSCVRQRSDDDRAALDNFLLSHFCWLDERLPSPANDRPDWRQQTGRMPTLVISCPWASIEVDGDNAYTREFDWWVEYRAVDAYGHVTGDTQHAMNGGLINHDREGGYPRWTSHT